jgi:hypothetical protein
LSARYFSSSSFIFKAYSSARNFFLKKFNFSDNLSSIFLKNYFKIFKKKFLLDTVLFIFKLKFVKIKKSFAFFYFKLGRGGKNLKKKKIKLREWG